MPFLICSSVICKIHHTYYNIYHMPIKPFKMPSLVVIFHRFSITCLCQWASYKFAMASLIQYHKTLLFKNKHNFINLQLCQGKIKMKVLVEPVFSLKSAREFLLTSPWLLAACWQIGAFPGFLCSSVTAQFDVLNNNGPIGSQVCILGPQLVQLFGKD